MKLIRFLRNVLKALQLDRAKVTDGFLAAGYVAAVLGVLGTAFYLLGKIAIWLDVNNYLMLTPADRAVPVAVGSVVFVSIFFIVLLGFAAYNVAKALKQIWDNS